MQKHTEINQKIKIKKRS